ncbi:MAG: SDR family oxidoreductase [Candidatus Dormibacteraeota bacterium]|nr:SDR family oxidoreductase [Candidatus Dormibacteraeota bacterium]MBO0743894.1 SDR family oxidoreductase [Candidatus Dormibacteraeota bacterium]
MPVALITGAGRPNGIAAATARRLAAAGWDLGLHHYDEDLAPLLADLSATGVRIHTHQADLGVEGAPEAAFDAVEGALGEVTALLLIHTLCEPRGLMATRPEHLDRHYAVNVRAALSLIQTFVNRLTASDGRIIALTSDHFTPENLAYGTTKAALDRVVLAAANELGARGIRANCVNPGPNDTGWMSDEIRDAAIRDTPLGRTSRPEDTADLVEFLLSPKGGWITGQVLYSNGGFRLNPF